MTTNTFVRRPLFRIFASALISILSLQAQTYRFSCPAYGGGYLPVAWQPRYSAYIPVDHLDGPTACTSGTFGDKTKIYIGDGNADIGDGYPVQSARVYGAISFYGSFNNGAQSSGPYRSSFTPDVGQTRNYG